MNQWIRRFLLGFVGLVTILALLVVGLSIFVHLTWDRPEIRSGSNLRAYMDDQTLSRGEFLYNYSMQCWHCHGYEGGHSMDEIQAGGREFDLTGVGPGFGIYYASNLTPDSGTGIGNWSDDELVRAIREGLDRDGLLIFPVHPSQFSHGLSDEDALALVAYMRSLPPEHNEVPNATFSFAAKALIVIGILKPQSAITEPVPTPPRGINAVYGEYLVWHASGCAECHTPRDPNTAELDLSRPLAGTLIPFTEEGFTTTGSNLTPCTKTGLGEWSEEDYLTAMHTGMRPDGTIMLPFHPWPYFDNWSEEDLLAIWMYLRSLEPIAHQVPNSMLTGAAASETGVAHGEALFDVYCVICHGKDGSGGTFSTIELKDVAQEKDDAAIAQFIADGFPNISKHTFGKTLTGEQIADLVAFIKNS